MTFCSKRELKLCTAKNAAFYKPKGIHDRYCNNATMSHSRAIFRIHKIHPKTFQFPMFITKFSKSCINVKYSTKIIISSCRNLLSDNLKNQNLDQARIIFDKIPSPDAYSYTLMINNYARNDKLSDALYLFDKMPVRDIISWNSMIQGCLDCGYLGMARKLFDEMPERNVVSWTTMVNGYLKFGKVEVAERLFWVMPVRDVAAWNAMIYGFCANGRVEEGLKLFERMPSRNVISWTSMIGGLDQNGKSDEGLSLFGKMMMESGVKPTSKTFACVLTACANATDFNLGVQVHSHAVQLGYSFDEFISASLITLYSNCNTVENAQRVFDETMSKNVVIWTALLSGYVLNSEHEDALRVFSDMIKMGVSPNQSTMSSAFNSCRRLEALDRGKEIHTVAVKLGLETDVFVGNSLIVMYNECGNLNDSVAVFKRIKEKNVVSWNSIIIGSSQYGHGMWVLIFFNQMIRAGVDPDEITFTGLLSACSHSGMLQKGRRFFQYAQQYKPIELSLQHYACMVDILGRSGKLDEAEELIENMPMEANSMIWLSLLSACRMHSNVDVAERAARHIFAVEPHCSAAYVLLSNLYASAGRWADVSRVRFKMKQVGIVKQPGSSWVVLRGRRHEFLSGDRSHPLSEKIYEKLDWLVGKLKELGYVPDGRLALHDVEDEQKEEMLSYHSERLAIGFALISTVEGSTITVMKNLRVCGDCHSVIKLITNVTGREIVVRDSSRFHHFRNGNCSCGDYW
ncbi:pentatricopeptide repeat-containing protein At5g46460, mitochondrial [Mercurialis annua]|uniref:pentatricopeptide repeat-containing protein At5g46460, mitochondrial n=1 Tax=Mercurialis annua TaxID=3986 RepID=UPI00215FFA18|nr:pentatricopeptide repeat-containing protein At5g46460, mitochondrial [Mercurialis annua]